MKKNLILNIITLFTTSLLLVFIVLAWFVTNQEVSVTGITGATANSKYSLKLQRGIYYYDTTESKYVWEWEDTKNLSMSNLQPGNAFFFRFAIDAKENVNLKVTLNNITSELQSDIFTRVSEVVDNRTKYYVSLNGLKLYEMDSLGSKVKILARYEDPTTHEIIMDDNHPLGVLYNYDSTSSKFTLEDFLVHNTFKFYDYGTGTENFYIPETTTFYDNNVTNDGAISSNPKPITNASAIYNVPAKSSETELCYGYFALEFNDAASIEEYWHFDGSLRSDSNLYQSQILTIRNVSVEEV